MRIRRTHLEDVIDGAAAVLLPVRRLADHGLKVWQEAVEHGYEGLVARWFVSFVAALPEPRLSERSRAALRTFFFRRNPFRSF